MQPVQSKSRKENDSHEIMDVKDVLKGFVDNCNERANYFQYTLSSNAVLEWFGRTFRGNKKIEQYLRYEIWPQYAQHFSVAVNCAAFEVKPSHLETREEPVENFQSSSTSCSISTVQVGDSFDSPPPARLNSVQPPPLTRGKRFRPLIDSDDESNTPIKKKTTQEKPDDSDDSETSSPHSGMALLNDSTDELVSQTEQNPSETVSKKRSASNDTATTPKRSKSNQTVTKRLEYFDKSAQTSALTDQSTSSCAKQLSSKQYSELKYLEAIGSIRTIRLMKHPQVNRLPTTPNANPETNTAFVSPESQNGWDRKTKLKLSYRVGIDNNDIQYALIIYEPLTMITRRNLLGEFQLAAAAYEDARTRSQHAKNEKLKHQSKSTPKKKKSATYMSLQRLRF